MRSFSLIATPKNPLTIKFFENIQSYNLNINRIYLVGKSFSVKDRLILKERTGKNFKSLELKNLTKRTVKKIYRFKSNQNFVKYIESKKRREDFFVNAGYVYKIPETVLNLPKYGILNCHPGILPYFKGSSCPEWAILLKKNLGLTVHLMNSEIDSGSIYKIKKINKQKIKDITYQKFRNIIFEEQIKFLCDCLSELILLKNIKNKFKAQKKSNKFFKPLNYIQLRKVKSAFK